MIIRVETRQVYGRPLRYVVSQHAYAIQRLTGRTTLTEDDMEALKALGFRIEAAS